MMPITDIPWTIRPDSNAPAVDFEKEIVTEETWIGVKENYLGRELSRIPGIDKQRNVLIKRIENGERTQTLWNAIMDLV